jgi:hypothetical protein
LGERRDVNRALMGKSERKRLLGRPWFSWEYNIEMDIQQV